MNRGSYLLVSFILLLTACGNVNTKAPDNNIEPVAVLGSGIDAFSRIPTEFDGGGSSDADGFIIAWIWDFGDGGTATGEVATHVYDSAGVYTATLVVRDDGQKEAEVTTTVTVADLNGLEADWTVTADPATTVCENTHASYALPFPAPIFTVSVSGETITGVAGLTGVSFSGTFDAQGLLTLQGASSDPTAACGMGNPVGRTTDEQFQLTFADSRSFSGRYVFQANANDPFCTCAKIFDVTGSR